MESLRSQLAAELPPKVFRAIVEQLAAEQVLVRADSLVRLPDAPRRPRPRRGARSPSACVAALAGAGFTPPDVKQLAADLGSRRHA